MRKSVLVLAAACVLFRPVAVQAADPVPDAAARAAMKTRDPLLAYTNAVHDGPYRLISKAALPTALGPAGIVGYTNTDKAPHATWGNVWYLVTPKGALFEITAVTQSGGPAESANYDGHPAVVISSGDMHQGIGNNAHMTVFHDGRDFRFHAEDQEFDGSGEEMVYSPATVTDGRMVLKPLPAGLARMLPPVKSFPKAPTYKPETH